MRSTRSLNSDRPVITDKREAILRAAIRVFAHNGYFSSKVADIASEAGVADGTVYLYFKSKDEIVRSIFDRSLEEAFAAVVSRCFSAFTAARHRGACGKRWQ